MRMASVSQAGESKASGKQQAQARSYISISVRRPRLHLHATILLSLVLPESSMSIWNQMLPQDRTRTRIRMRRRWHQGDNIQIFTARPSVAVLPLALAPPLLTHESHRLSFLLPRPPLDFTHPHLIAILRANVDYLLACNVAWTSTSDALWAGLFCMHARSTPSRSTPSPSSDIDYR